jgi:molybdopterin synthase sulfur carrier subunit
MSLKIVYFASVRERVGKTDETVTPPASIVTVADLVAWLASRGPEYAAAFDSRAQIRAAIDHTHAKSSAPIGSAREIAFFPPVTGG